MKIMKLGLVPCPICEGAHINNQQSHFGTSDVTLQSETQVLLKLWAFYLLVPFMCRHVSPFLLARRRRVG